VIVKAESLALVGAEISRVQHVRANGSVYYSDKHVLPRPDNIPRHNSNGRRLFSPDWMLGVKANTAFINAVTSSVQKVQVSINSFYL
jgi:hypothetical protein